MSLIYHYTSAEGLYGILKEQHIRMTNTSFLNDVSELRHGYELYFNAEFFEGKNSTMKSLLEFEIRKKLMFNPSFICSFTQKKDDLRQWMSYCPDGGYAIGFELSDLKKSNPLITFEPVEYIDDKKGMLSDRKIDEVKGIKELAAKSINPAPGTFIPNSTLLDKKMRALATDALKFKKIAFKEEEEVRGIWVDTNGVLDEDLENDIKADFYIKNGILIPYQKLTFNKLAVKEIVISPTLDQELASYSLLAIETHLVNEYDVYEFNPCKSEIKLR